MSARKKDPPLDVAESIRMLCFRYKSRRNVAPTHVFLGALMFRDLVAQVSTSTDLQLRVLEEGATVRFDGMSIVLLDGASRSIMVGTVVDAKEL